MILEYLEDTQAPALHPADPLARAEHRAWIEFGSAILNDIWGLYVAPDEGAFAAKAAVLRAKFLRVETRLKGPWFDGARFGLVDAVFGPVFRYFDAFDRVGEFGILSGLPKVAAWRAALAERPSIKGAVAPDYPALLWDFYRTRGSHLSRLIEQLDAPSSAAAWAPVRKRVAGRSYGSPDGGTSGDGPCPRRERQPHDDGGEWLMLLLLSLLWGGSFFFTGIAVKELPPLTIVVLRVGLAALMLLARCRCSASRCRAAQTCGRRSSAWGCLTTPSRSA